MSQPVTRVDPSNQADHERHAPSGCHDKVSDVARVDERSTQQVWLASDHEAQEAARAECEERVAGDQRDVDQKSTDPAASAAWVRKVRCLEGSDPLPPDFYSWFVRVVRASDSCSRTERHSK